MGLPHVGHSVLRAMQTGRYKLWAPHWLVELHCAGSASDAQFIQSLPVVTRQSSTVVSERFPFCQLVPRVHCAGVSLGPLSWDYLNARQRPPALFERHLLQACVIWSGGQITRLLFDGFQ